MKPPTSASSENCIFPMAQGVLMVVVQIGNFPLTSSCRLGEQCQLAHVFSQPFPYSLSLCIATFRISLWLPVKAISIQGFQFLTRNPGTYLIQHQIAWAALTFPGTPEGTGSDCSAVCCFLILSSGLRHYVLVLLSELHETWVRSFQVAEELKWESQCTSWMSRTSFPPASNQHWVMKADQSESGLYRGMSWSWEVKHYLVKHWKHF